jgi:hypothetical protein
VIENDGLERRRPVGTPDEWLGRVCRIARGHEHAADAQILGGHPLDRIVGGVARRARVAFEQ